MAPPQLAADVPVPDVRQPVLPRLLEPLREDPGPTRPRRLESAGGQGLGPDEPLDLESRLDHVVGTLAAAEDHLVGAFPLEVATGREVRQDARPGLEAIEAGVGGAPVIDRPVVCHHVDRGKAVTAPRLEVRRVVGRCHLHGARPERTIDRLVGHDRDIPIDERDADAPPDQRGIAIVGGMDGDAGVAEDRLRTGRRDGDPGCGIGQAGGLVDEVVADRPERPGRRRGDHLEVGDARPAAGAPVDQGLGPVGEAGPPEGREGMANGLRAPVVHREAEAAPVGGGPHAALLTEHHVPRGVGERPHALQVAVASE